MYETPPGCGDRRSTLLGAADFSLSCCVPVDAEVSGASTVQGGLADGAPQTADRSDARRRSSFQLLLLPAAAAADPTLLLMMMMMIRRWCWCCCCPLSFSCLPSAWEGTIALAQGAYSLIGLCYERPKRKHRNFAIGVRNAQPSRGERLKKRPEARETRLPACAPATFDDERCTPRDEDAGR